MSHPFCDDVAMFDNLNHPSAARGQGPTFRKALVNRQWQKLFRDIHALPDNQGELGFQDNPLIDFVFGHQRLDRYLDCLREKGVSR